MDEFLNAFTRWEWWAIIGFVLVVLEVFMPGAIFLWPALAALTLAAVTWLSDFDWQVYMILFALLTLVYAFAGRNAYLKMRDQSDQPMLNKRSHQLVGKYCEIVETTNLERGRVRMGDSTWLARSAAGTSELVVGEHVQVTAVEGTTLIVSRTAPR